MKTTMLLFLITIIATVTSSAQSHPLKQKVYYAIVTTVDQNRQKGILHDVSDSSLTLLFDNGTIAHEVNYRDITQIKLHKKGKIGKDIGIGAGTGAVVGLTIGTISAASTDYPLNDPVDIVVVPVEMVAVMVAATFFGALIGSGTGAIAGIATDVKLEVNSDKEKFKAAVAEIRKRCVLK